MWEARAEAYRSGLGWPGLFCPTQNQLMAKRRVLYKQRPAKSPRPPLLLELNTLEPCIATLETSMSITQDTLESLEERVKGLKGEYANLR